MPIPKFEQDPSSKLDYTINWAAWLAGDTIQTSTWSKDPVTPVLSGEASTATSTTVFVAFAGVDGDIATITNHIVTAGGREHDQSFKLKLKSQ